MLIYFKFFKNIKIYFKNINFKKIIKQYFFNHLKLKDGNSYQEMKLCPKFHFY